MVDKNTKMANSVLKKIEWLGHAGFMIKASGKTVVIDPFQVTKDIKADLVLLTHSHYDHCSIADLEKIRKPDTKFVTESDSAGKFEGDTTILKPNEKTTVLGFDIKTVPAYNTNKNFHPKESGWLGFIINIDGVNVYHAGDTDLIPEMNSVKTDIMLVPVSGTYLMTAEEAIEAVTRIKPAIAVPMHYDAIVGTKKDADFFKEGCKDICEVVIKD